MGMRLNKREIHVEIWKEIMKKELEKNDKVKLLLSKLNSESPLLQTNYRSEQKNISVFVKPELNESCVPEVNKGRPFQSEAEAKALNASFTESTFLEIKEFLMAVIDMSLNFPLELNKIMIEYLLIDFSTLKGTFDKLNSRLNELSPVGMVGAFDCAMILTAQQVLSTLVSSSPTKKIKLQSKQFPHLFSLDKDRNPVGAEIYPFNFFLLMVSHPVYALKKREKIEPFLWRGLYLMSPEIANGDYQKVMSDNIYIGKYNNSTLQLVSRYEKEVKKDFISKNELPQLEPFFLKNKFEQNEVNKCADLLPKILEITSNRSLTFFARIKQVKNICLKINDLEQDIENFIEWAHLLRDCQQILPNLNSPRCIIM